MRKTVYAVLHRLGCHFNFCCIRLQNITAIEDLHGQSATILSLKRRLDPKMIFEVLIGWLANEIWLASLRLYHTRMAGRDITLFVVWPKGELLMKVGKCHQDFKSNTDLALFTDCSTSFRIHQRFCYSNFTVLVRSV